MDPNMMHVDWERTFEALALVIIFAFIVERALAVIFETRWFIKYLDRGGIKEIISIAAAIAVCAWWKLDALGMIILTETTTIEGYIVTGLVVAGGSKASIKLFHDVLDVKSSAYDSRHEIRAQKASVDAKTAEAVAMKAPNPEAAEKELRKIEAAKQRATQAATNSSSSVVAQSLSETQDAEKAVLGHIAKLRGGKK